MCNIKSKLKSGQNERWIKFVLRHPGRGTFLSFSHFSSARDYRCDMKVNSSLLRLRRQMSWYNWDRFKEANMVEHREKKVSREKKTINRG